MAESTPLEDIETGKKEKHVRYFKARVLDSHQSEGINGLVRDCMEDGAIVFSDKSSSCVDISDLVGGICTSPRNQTPKRPRKHSNGCIWPSVTQKEHCWATTIKSTDLGS